ncbi:MAG: response regulator transcription factor [Xanthomonadales bacterium]|nr:response regulator transcription factor [Xanthomonadales bacterium]MCB1634178.1 response regulator transcription factor [Xanthomonadales bacterium]MCB1642787.1 response regulator transcription factor [Xanthomonadales bacterium]
MRVLLVEDDGLIADGIVEALRGAGMVVNWLAQGQPALQALRSDPPDILVLDLGLPDIDGMELLRQAKRLAPELQVLVLTARDSTEAKVQGLDLGADDYLTKPFARAELLARLRVLERRLGNNVGTALIEVGPLQLDTRRLQASLDGEPLTLSRREYMLLKALVENAGVIQTRDALETRLYGWGEEVASNAIEVHIHHLRRKLPANFIKTLRGIGYLVPKP